MQPRAGLVGVTRESKGPGESDIAGCPGNCILSDSEKEGGIPEDLKQDVPTQLSEDQILDKGAASPQKQQRAAWNKSSHQKRGSRKHILIADDQKPQVEENPKCTVCGKGFKWHSRLLNHMQIHTRGKIFECVECGKSFSRKANLVVHQRIHMGEKPCKCKECGKTFISTSSLVAHRKIHAKKKSFTCSMCGKSFSGLAGLFRHQRVHTDDKPYRCTECGNSFSLSSNLIRHQRIHLKERSSEHTADANSSEFTSLHHKEKQMCGSEKLDTYHLIIVYEEMKKMRENMDMLLLNQQSQLQVLQEIQKQLNILLLGNDLINSNVYSLGLLLGRQAAAAASVSFPLLNPSRLLPENVNFLSLSSAHGTLPTTQLAASQDPPASAT